MKTIFIMGILSFFCGISAAQPQYWGEGAYDLENVVFGMKVDKYYSKAKTYDEDDDESFRYFMKKKVKCTAVLCDCISLFYVMLRAVFLENQKQFWQF